MTDKELRHLSRMELIQLLLEQTRETERLQRELDAAKEELNDRHVLISNAGSIAEAAVELNRLMETAQAAADQYVESVKCQYAKQIQQEYDESKEKMARLEQETRLQCEQMLQEAKRKAEDYGGGA